MCPPSTGTAHLCSTACRVVREHFVSRSKTRLVPRAGRHRRCHADVSLEQRKYQRRRDPHDIQELPSVPRHARVFGWSRSQPRTRRERGGAGERSDGLPYRRRRGTDRRLLQVKAGMSLRKAENNRSPSGLALDRNRR